ncbi:MAG: mannose-1-phosphate guanylyltransferase [Candidatus Cloacimonadaceae bacterium]|jgi:mannose-1-phosphate guanylyltransferase|nr:NTP transferase domain-containing protein [Candidatus Cloacimonadota bacterium]MDY0127928.1 mannose-1-phosphate guanylyltransferase [Candidatus Cloacimonadaceae bacterium]MCB5255282.1 NTP transferase domain-containing protein [Candidatus Cloacimonadota bacterium]MCK9177990.1 sugar phosphate nucleotidyltransferase [Candidatus Cloacimonadota bacterium]MCK9243188.1 sugar phosphate nucleotidyltransferase [Candidatus Cloacimonadota bacterium]
MIAVIMAGGSGTRFWPQSRKDHPKQFLKIAGDRSMIQLTVDRLLPLIPIARIYIVTAADQAALVAEHLPELPPDNIIIEPFGMNTAACIALSLQYLKPLYGEDTTMLVLPADHVIQDTKAFHNSLKKAHQAARGGALITFGIVPDYPATGYGYIEAGSQVEPGVFRVLKFKEKPDLKTASSFIEQGGFYWNSGMFCWSLAAISDAFQTHLPQAFEICAKIGKIWQEQGRSADVSELYRQVPRLPIDIGIMEKAELRYVIPVQIGWSDVGSFKALAEINPADSEGNASNSEIMAIDSRDNFVQSSKFTALIGVDNLCIIETEDAMLITTKDRAEEVKLIVEKLHQAQRDDLL